MAYRHSLTASVRLLARKRFAPSISCTHHEDDRKNSHSDEKLVRPSFLQRRSYGCNTNTWLGFGNGGVGFRDSKRCRFLHLPMTTSGFLLARKMSTTNVEDKIECIADVSSQVAVAAADSWPPVAALQYAIDGIHIYTGLNWWASLVITTLVIRTLSIPLLINQIKVSSEFIILRPELEQIKQEMYDRGVIMGFVDEAEVEERMDRVYKEHGIGHFTPFKSLFILGPVYVSFYLAIQNMVEKVPSFQTGGVSWFIDLTTADSFYILPFLTAFSFLVTVESKTPRSYKRDPGAVKMKTALTGLSVLTFPLAATFPNAVLCCWITSNCFSLVYGIIIDIPSVKKLLNIRTIEPHWESSESMQLQKQIPPSPANVRRTQV